MPLSKKEFARRKHIKDSVAAYENQEQELSQAQTLPDAPEVNRAVSLYDLPKFPAATKCYRFTPGDLKKLLEEYTETVTPLETLCAKYGIKPATWWLLVREYPELRRDYQAATRAKASQYGKVAVELYTSEIPSEFYEVDKFGCTKLSMAGIQYIKNKHEAMIRQAQIHETGTYVQKSRVESQNLNVSVNANVELDPKSIHGSRLDDLLSAFR